MTTEDIRFKKAEEKFYEIEKIRLLALQEYRNAALEIDKVIRVEGYGRLCVEDEEDLDKERGDWISSSDEC